MIRENEVILQIEPHAPYAEVDRDFSIGFFMIAMDKEELTDCTECQNPCEVIWQNSTDQINMLGADYIVAVYDQTKNQKYQSVLANQIMQGPFVLALKKKDGTYIGFKDQKTAHNVAAWFVSQQVTWGRTYHGNSPRRTN